MEEKVQDARMRLQTAAVELFGERGYDETTAAQIAARAGVTERTFFRHFPVKREVLFDGQAVLLAALTRSMAAAPMELGPLDTLFAAFRSVLPVLEGNRPFARPRQAIIAATPALQERELTKHEALADALAELLVKRGNSELEAKLAARIAMTAFTHATMAWLEDEGSGLAARLDEVEQALKELCG